MMAKTGKTAKDIFAPTSKKPGQAAAPAQPGRPTTHEEPWKKVTVVLFNRQILFLDRLALDIMAANGTAISRAELLRSLVDVLAESGIDLTAATSEAELKELIREGLGQ